MAGMTEDELDKLLGPSGERSADVPDWVGPAVTSMVGAVTGRTLGGAVGGGAGGAIGTMMGGLLGGAAGSGALNGLVDRFNQAGLGAKAQSWVSAGENQSLHPDEVERALGSDAINAIADQAAKSPQEVKAGLAHALPRVVNALTPEGSVPDDAELAGLGERLARAASSRPVSSERRVG